MKVKKKARLPGGDRKKKRNARRLALSLLYAAEINALAPGTKNLFSELIREHPIESLLLVTIGASGESDSSATGDADCAYDEKLAEILFSGTLTARSEIDAILRESLENWSVERLSPVEKNILRMAIYEILHQPGTPVPVLINEAVELARQFGSEKSPGFVNGVLDAIRKKYRDANPT